MITRVHTYTILFGAKVNPIAAGKFADSANIGLHRPRRGRVAYAIHPDHQGNGYATEAAAALVDFAFADGGIHVVRAHTLPESNASTRVLIKCGFLHVSQIEDPDDGLVWRWEKHGSDAATERHL